MRTDEQLGQVVRLATCPFLSLKNRKLKTGGLCMFNDLESKLQSLLERNITSVSELESWISVELRLNAEIQMLRLIF